MTLIRKSAEHCYVGQRQCWRDVVGASRNEEQRSPRVIPKIDCGRGVRIEIGESGLEQHVVGTGHCVPLIYGQRLLFTQIVRESVYGATKAALLSLARTLSIELIPRGIRVNAVSPGPIATPLYNKLGLSAADLRAVSESLERQIPARRFGKPSEIASAVVFLASDEAAFAVGSELIVDGGLGL